MAYFGRVVGLGLTRDSKPAVIYAVSGRSPPSKERFAKIYDDGSQVRRRVFIDSLKPLPPEKAAIYNYNAIIAYDNNELAVVSNGIHTNKIDANLSSPYQFPLLKVLGKMGHEGHVGDKYNTPRIAGIRDRFSGSMGMVTEWTCVADDTNFSEGEFSYISTYTGEEGDPKVPRFENFQDIIKTLTLGGLTAQQLADEFYEWLDPAVRVCTAAAVLYSGRWRLGTKNLHQV